MGSTSVITVSLLLATLGLKATDLAKYLVAVAKNRKDKDALDGIITMLVTGAIGVALAFVLRKSSWGDEIRVGNKALTQLGDSSTVLFGFVFTALAGTLYDFKKALDRSATPGNRNFL